MIQPSTAEMQHEDTVSRKQFPGGIALFRALTEHVPGAAVFVVNQDFRYLFAGGGGLQAAGMTPADFEGKYLGDVVPVEFLSQYLADYTAIFAGETFVREHFVGTRFYRTRGRLIKGANNARDLALAVSYDVTDELKTTKD